MSDTNQKIIIAVGVLLLFVLLWFGWPTPYRYAVLHRADSQQTTIVRINRITGETQWNDGRGWFPQN